jgi:hypothetical protein
MSDEKEAIPELEPVPAHVLCCNFWLLAAEDCCSNAKAAWYEVDGQAKPVAEAISEWQRNRSGPVQPERESKSVQVPTEPENRSEHSIQHYLLLPVYEWGVADWHLDVIRPFVKKYQPTVGYSLDEASKAARVTVVGGAKSFPLEIIEELKAGGREVMQIEGDGTVIATQLENL